MTLQGHKINTKHCYGVFLKEPIAVDCLDLFKKEKI